MLNKTILMGRLTRDPEVRIAPTNNATVCNFSLAVDRGYVKPGEQRQADFINCVAFGKTGEFIKNYFTKGRMIAISGRLQSRSWDDAEGKKHFAVDVVIEEASFCGDKKAEGQAQSQADENGYMPYDDSDSLPF